jgi:hypothetical protein
MNLLYQALTLMLTSLERAEVSLLKWIQGEDKKDQTLLLPSQQSEEQFQHSVLMFLGWKSL